MYSSVANLNLSDWLPPSSLPGQSLLEEVDPQRIDACYQDVDADVKLDVVDQQRMLDIPLDTQGVIRADRNVAELVDYFDTGTAGGAGWLDDPETTLLGLFLSVHCPLEAFGLAEKQDEENIRFEDKKKIET